MNRRTFMLGAAGVGALMVGAGALLRPSDRGSPYNEYFRALNQELKRHGPMRPVMLIDLDLLDHNINVVKQSVTRAGKHLRLVEKSLPSPGLLTYIAKRTDTRRLMSFHQPFLNHDAVTFPEADILLGKPFTGTLGRGVLPNPQGNLRPFQATAMVARHPPAADGLPGIGARPGHPDADQYRAGCRPAPWRSR